MKFFQACEGVQGKKLIFVTYLYPVGGKKSPEQFARGQPCSGGSERVMGFEPTNNGLGSRCLTTWRHPRLGRWIFYHD